MARKQRLESSDGLYHIINRGNYRSLIFESEGARSAFEKTLFEACERNSWELLAYCILSNHYHLCIATPHGNLSEGMRWLQATYATRFNRLRKEQGHLFQGRFKSLIVEPGKHLTTLIDYIHLNPCRAGLENPQCIGHYPWSSLFHFPKIKKRSKVLEPKWISYLAIMDDSRGGWIRYLNSLKLKLQDNPEEIAKVKKLMNRGWCIGSQSYKKALASDYLEKVGILRLEHNELKEFNWLQWDQYLKKALLWLGKDDVDIVKSKYTEDWKLAIACKMKRETSVSNQWLSEQLQMGVPNGVSSTCGRYHREKEMRCRWARKLKKFIFEH